MSRLCCFVRGSLINLSVLRAVHRSLTVCRNDAKITFKTSLSLRSASELQPYLQLREGPQLHPGLVHLRTPPVCDDGGGGERGQGRSGLLGRHEAVGGVAAGGRGRPGGVQAGGGVL